MMKNLILIFTFILFVLVFVIKKLIKKNRNANENICNRATKYELTMDVIMAWPKTDLRAPHSGPRFLISILTICIMIAIVFKQIYSGLTDTHSDISTGEVLLLIVVEIIMSIALVLMIKVKLSHHTDIRDDINVDKIEIIEDRIVDSCSTAVNEFTVICEKTGHYDGIVPCAKYALKKGDEVYIVREKRIVDDNSAPLFKPVANLGMKAFPLSEQFITDNSGNAIGWYYTINIYPKKIYYLGPQMEKYCKTNIYNDLYDAT